jgi:hypothetical protein
MKEIKTANDLRIALMATIQGLIDGEITPIQAQVITGLSEQVHKSVEQEWGMRVYAYEVMGIDAKNTVCLLGNDNG